MPTESRPSAVTCFSVAARSDPSAMPRVLELFAKRGLVPLRFSGTTLPGRSGELEIDIHMEGLCPDQADYLARCMEQITCVERVETGEQLAN